jgi:hypothetical protein
MSARAADRADAAAIKTLPVVPGAVRRMIVFEMFRARRLLRARQLIERHVD